MILSPSREILLPPPGASPSDWLAWFTAGKGQRNPANGKGKRKTASGTVGTTPRNTTATACCCGGCPGTACSFCAQTSKGFLISFSGVNVFGNGTCSDDGTNSVAFAYSGGGTNLNASGVCLSTGPTACVWGTPGSYEVGGTGGSISPNNMIGSGGVCQEQYFAGSISCAGAPTTRCDFTAGDNLDVIGAIKRTSATQWDAQLVMAARSGSCPKVIIFYATTTASGTDCFNIGTLSFTNSLAGTGSFFSAIDGRSYIKYGNTGSMTVTQNCCA